MGIGDRQPVVTTDNGGNNQAVTTTTTTTTTQSNPTPAAAKPTDVNIADPRLLINGTCIYERRLPGHAYITAHVQRLQHGYYSCPALSNAEFEHVDFLAVNFVFHAPHTSSHRFKAARIRASISNKDICPQHPFSNAPIENPRFLMYAPHLIYGAVSPESLGVGLGMRGSVGVSQFPVNASVIPSGVMNESYKRFEMMRIQGSVRTLVSPWGDRFDVDAGEISWSMEENSLQRSGLPREFTFVMLVQKPRADSDISFNLRIKPRIQTRIGRVWKLRLALPKYRTWRRKPVDFNKEIGQRFQPVSSDKGYNFADIQSCLDDYVNMPGSTYTPKASQPPGEIAS